MTRRTTASVLALAALVLAAAVPACERVGNLGFDREDAAVDVGDARDPGASAPGEASAPGDPDPGDGGPARDAADASPWPCGYPCDPVTDQGCGADQGCFLRSTTTRLPDGGEHVTESVACVPRGTSCGLGDDDHCRVPSADGGFFRGGTCIESGGGTGFCMVACQRGTPDTARGCPAPRTCDPAGANGCYGFCNRVFRPTADDRP